MKSIFEIIKLAGNQKMSSFSCLLLLATCLLSLSSCEKDLEVYNTETCRLNFYYDLNSRAGFNESLARTTYSFIYGSSDRERDTLWFDVQTMGFTSDHERPVTLQQLPSDGVQAVPGKHYVAFDDPSVSHLYVIPANRATTKLPVIILRDPSLKNEAVTLKFGFKENEYFQLGFEEFSTRLIEMTDMLSEPSAWNAAYPIPGLERYFPQYALHCSDYFGEYGVVKHQFLIEQTGKKWDDEYIESLIKGDSNYLKYLVRKMSKRLDEVNAERVAKGLDVLKEADGTIVEIVDVYAS